MTPDGFLSVRDFGAVGDGVADDSAAFSAAGAAAIAASKSLWVPPGTYRIAALVNFDGDASYQRSFEMVCALGAATLLIDCPAANAFAFANFYEWRVEGFLIRGVTGRLVDCVRVFYGAASYLGVVQDCSWKWVCSSTALIHNIGGGMLVARNAFIGASSQGPLIACDDWTRMIVEDVTVADIGYIGGVTTGSKIGTNANQTCPTWFLRCDDVSALIGAFSQAPLHVERVWVDENIAGAVQVNPTGAALAHATIIDFQKSSGIVTGFDTVAEFDIRNTENLDLVRSCALQLGGGGGMQRDAISLVDVGHARIERFRCATIATDTNRIAADSACGTVELVGMLPGAHYRTLASSAELTETSPDSFPGSMVVSDRKTTPDLLTLLDRPRLFLDARDIIVAAGATAIDKWGNQRSHVDTTLAVASPSAAGGVRPSTGRTINARPAVDFDGTDDVLTSASDMSVLVFAGGYYIAIVALADAIAGTNSDFREGEGLFSDGQGYLAAGFRTNGGLYYVNGGHYSTTWKQPATPFQITLGTAFLYEQWYDGTNISVSVNGAAAQTIAAGSIDVTTGALRIGRNYASVYLNGLIAKMITCANPQTANVRKAVRAALSNEFALGILA